MDWVVTANGALLVAKHLAHPVAIRTDPILDLAAMLGARPRRRQLPAR
jgi:hypothetical protein